MELADGETDWESGSKRHKPRLGLMRAFMMSCGDVMAEFFHIIVLLRNHVTCLIRLSADDHLVITP